MAFKKITSYLIFALALLFSAQLKAQDPTFSQFYANPLYLNPAFAGSEGCPKIHINFRDQWPSLSGTFVTQTISYDQHIAGANSGYGIMLMYDNAGAGILNTLRASGMYSYHLKLNKKWHVLAGAEATVHSKFIDKDRLVFGDQIDKNSGEVFQSSAELQNIADNRVVLDVGLGAIIYSEQFFFGYANHHVNQPNESFLNAFSVQNLVFDPQSKLFMRHTFHTGANFSVSGNKRKGVIGDGPFATVGFIGEFQGPFDQYNLGVSLTNKSLSGGLWYRVNRSKREIGDDTKAIRSDALIFVLGYTYRNLRIGYSYDITVSELAGDTGGAHEFSLRIQLPCKVKKKVLQPILCPKF